MWKQIGKYVVDDFGFLIFSNICFIVLVLDTSDLLVMFYR